MAGFAILGATEPDFYRGSATGIPRNKPPSFASRSRARALPLLNLKIKKLLAVCGTALSECAKALGPIIHCLAVNKSPAVYIFIRALDDLY